jgi:transcriptional regulator with XRE-family HTH domain
MRTDVGQVKARRLRLGYNITDFAAEAGISRDTLSDLEAGNKRPHPDTLAKVLDALERLEREMGVGAPLPAGARRIGDPADDLVEFSIEGNFGVRAVVKGPIRDLDALQAAVSKLIAGMQAEQDLGRDEDAP